MQTTRSKEDYDYQQRAARTYGGNREKSGKKGITYESANNVEDVDDNITDSIKTDGWKQLNENKPPSSCRSVIVSLPKYPELIVLDGIFAQIDRQKIHDKVYTYVSGIYDLVENQYDLFEVLKRTYLHDLEKHKNKDLSVMKYVQGCRVVACLKGDPRIAIKCYKSLMKVFDSYKLKHKNIVFSLICHNYFVLYMHQRKLGKAHYVMKMAKLSLQNYYPSTWTSLLYKMQCRIYDHIAQVTQKERLKCQQLAIQTYKQARNHSSEENEDKYFALMYTVDIMYITMDMPTTNTWRDFRNSDITLQRLRSYQHDEGSKAKLYDAFQMLNKVKKDVLTLSKSYQNKINERINFIGNIYYLVRKCQLSLHCSDHGTAKHYVKEGLHLYNSWQSHFSQVSDSEFMSCTCLADNIKTVLDELDSKITMMYEMKILLNNASKEVEADVGSSCTDGENVVAVGSTEDSLEVNTTADIEIMDHCFVANKTADLGTLDSTDSFGVKSTIVSDKTEKFMETVNTQMSVKTDYCEESGNVTQLEPLVSRNNCLTDIKKGKTTDEYSTDEGSDSALFELSGLGSEAASGSDIP